MVGWHHNLWETLKDREAWLAIIHGIRESDTALSTKQQQQTMCGPDAFLPTKRGSVFQKASERRAPALEPTELLMEKEGWRNLKSPNGPTAKAEERKREGWSPSIQRPRGSWPGAHQHQHNSGLPGWSAGLHCTAVVPSLKWFPLVRGT